MAELQRALLAAAAKRLAPGGRLVFATCSLQAEEGEAHLAAAEALGLVVDPVRPEEVPGLAEAITPAGTLRTRPDMWAEHGGMDGFFVARFRKAALSRPLSGNDLAAGRCRLTRWRRQFLLSVIQRPRATRAR